ncbi:MAG: putative bifunctional diguanylate cyclase/phosphodiesterase [Burkholderiaceae bacterium]
MSRKPERPAAPAARLRDERDAAREEARALREKLAALEEQLRQLREANEHLVGATLHAQTLSDAMELAKRQLFHAAHHDPLTGLPNRKHLHDQLERAMALAGRYGQKLAILFLDLDRFKHVNDSLGHSVGDRLLQSVATRIRQCVRGSDIVSRQGGDEFLVLMPCIAHEDEAVRLASKIQAAIGAPHAIDGDCLLQVTASIGICLYPDHGSDPDALVRCADGAMYHAKEQGRDHCHVFSQELEDRAIERQVLENSLHGALDRGEFVLHYQPRVDLATGGIAGAEALLRWRHPQRGIVHPAQFVPVAEDNGAIIAIGQWALRTACAQMRAWLDTGLPLGRIAVNVSALEFRSRGFLDGVRAILADTGLDPHCLEIELTESVLMKDAASAVAVLASLDALGVQLAVDDFGTGYSSLNYLKRFPISALKIDQSFVRGLETIAEDAVIVGAVIGMGKSLNLKVIAEGVETDEQLAFLRQHHCDEVQGYLFGRPVPADDFAALLTRPAEQPCRP